MPEIVGGSTFCGFALPAAIPAPASSANAETTTVATPAPKKPPTSSHRLFGVDFMFEPLSFVLRWTLWLPGPGVEKRLSQNAYNARTAG
jgi:hypothetical protein